MITRRDETRTGEPPPRIGYVLKMFPRLSETFILNEVLELERQGGELAVYSLFYPNDGKFHGRLGELRTTAEYFRGGKLESTWSAVRALPGDVRTPFARWQDAADFLERHAVPKDLDILLRAGLIAARVRQQGVRHLHAHFATSATRMAAVVSMLTGVPFSFTAHAKDIFSAGVDYDLLAELVDRAAFVITVSDFNREFLLSRLPASARDKVQRLYNGIDLDFFTPPARSVSGERPHVVSVGRLVAKKGFDHLLHAFSHCKKAGFSFRATLVGDGPEMAPLCDLRERLGLVEEVDLPGGLPQEQVRGLLEKASFVALACVPDADGDMDALPTVLLEALALDLPIVATRLTGIPEIVGDEAGELVEPGDDEGMARAIGELWSRIRSGGIRPGIARARAERLFDLRKNAAVLGQLFSRSAMTGAIR